MPSMNVVALIGNVTRDAETTNAAGGTTITRFSVALQEAKKTHFIDCTAFGQTAEFAAKYFTKGALVSVQGHLQLEQWEKDGQKRSKVSVIAERVNFLRDGRQTGEAQQQDTRPQIDEPPTTASRPGLRRKEDDQPPANPAPTTDADDETLPF